MNEEPGQLELCVEVHEAGFRLDAFVAAHLPQSTRSQVAHWIRRGDVRVDHSQRKAGYRVKPGEWVLVRIPAAVPTQMIPEPIPLDILFEDRALIVINKPSGLVVHPSAGHASGTLVHGLLHHCPDLEGIGGEKRPGIVHRLDKDTSGVLLVAKNEHAHQSLARQFKERSIYKRYLALVTGTLKQSSGIIDRPVARHSSDRKKMAVVAHGGREAVTLWRVIERLAGATMLEVELKTGRTHQIRVHCHSMGYPIVGDPVYGRRRAMTRSGQKNEPGITLLGQAQRQMLHAVQLRFTHPLSNELMSLEAPLPEDMASLLEDLRELKDKKPI
ncbi:MAG: RluA family pseudouridine synthase [Desulfobacteraceae bacterium]|nr:MAG: RluA family pseudouridine synthase [Desulfobacteraceae bacterium]